jgi:hypothetical protein
MSLLASPSIVRSPLPASASEALLVVSRLMRAATAPDGGLVAVREALVREAPALVRAEGAVLLEVGPATHRGVPVAGDLAPGARGTEIEVDGLERRGRAVVVEPEQAAPLEALFAWRPERVVAVSLRPAGHLLLLAGGSFELETAASLADVACAVIEQARAAEDHAHQVARHSALTRAAKSLHEAPDLETLLSRICTEARTILEADLATIYRGTPQDGLMVAATAGGPPEVIGYRLATGGGLAGKVLRRGRSMLTNDYQRIAGLPDDSPFARYRASVAVPFQWSDELRGVLSVGYAREHEVTQDDVALSRRSRSSPPSRARTRAATPASRSRRARTR